MRIISEDITNKGIAKSNGGGGGLRGEVAALLVVFAAH